MAPLWTVTMRSFTSLGRLRGPGAGLGLCLRRSPWRHAAESGGSARVAAGREKTGRQEPCLAQVPPVHKPESGGPASRTRSSSPAIEAMMMSEVAKDRTALSLKKRVCVSALSGREFRRRELHGHLKDCVSTLSYVDEPSQRDDASRFAVQVENTYQLGPAKHFPVLTVNHILKEVLTNYLQEEQYEPEFCRQMTKTISEVIKAQVKDLMIPRYKLIVIVHIGQMNSQSMLIGSRCLWNPKSDTVSSYVFRNSSLFALANVYAVYFE